MQTKELQNTELLPERTLFVDIETLGFSADTLPIYMIGTAHLTEENTTEITLFFAETMDEEPEVLSAFAEQAAAFDTICTFNGTTFDLPYIKKRCRKHGMADPLADKDSLDLFKICKKRKSLLQLSGCRQKDIEIFLGIHREDQMSGGELVSVYRQYAKHPSNEQHDLLIGHNLDDVRGMLLLLPILSYESLSDAVLSSPKASVESAEARYILTADMDITIPVPLRHRTEEYYLILEGNTAKCAFVLHADSVRYFFDPPSDYVYLISEERVIPKALASAIPKSEKRAARPEECFTSVAVNDVSRPAEDFLCRYVEQMIRRLFKK